MSAAEYEVLSAWLGNKMIAKARSHANGNQTHAARLLDMSRDALRYKLKKFELVGAGEAENPVSGKKTRRLKWEFLPAF